MSFSKRVAIFDTNVINGKKITDNFFGGRAELEKFSIACEIVIPEVVIDEIKKQKRQHLIEEKSKFLSNPFRYLFGVEQEKIDTFDIEAKLGEIEGLETIPHTVIKLTKGDALERIRTMCHECKAPFGEKEDKGFKDAYLLLTVEEFIESVDDDTEVYVVVRDGKLEEALANLPRVTVVKNFDEFEVCNKSKFIEPYFIERLSETIGEQLTADSILNADLNINDNWLLEVDTPEKPTYVEIDFKSKEPIDHVKVYISNGIGYLVNSNSFDTTDKWVERLGDYVQYFNNGQMIELIKGSISNDQIYWIASKDTIKQFFYPIFEKVEGLLDERTKNRFIEKFEHERG